MFSSPQRATENHRGGAGMRSTNKPKLGELAEQRRQNEPTARASGFVLSRCSVTKAEAHAVPLQTSADQSVLMNTA